MEPHIFHLHLDFPANFRGPICLKATEIGLPGRVRSQLIWPGMMYIARLLRQHPQWSLKSNSVAKLCVCTNDQTLNPVVCICIFNIYIYSKRQLAAGKLTATGRHFPPLQERLHSHNLHLPTMHLKKTSIYPKQNNGAGIFTYIYLVNLYG